MVWLLIVLLLGIAVALIYLANRAQSASPQPLQAIEEKPYVEPADDFAGNSVGAFFLLDEIVDNPQTGVKKDNGLTFTEDVLYYDIDLEDEFFEES